MTNLLSYSGIVTKVRAMEAKLLNPDNFQEIVQFNGVTAFATYLRKQPAYEEAFANFDERLLHRGDIEKILILSLYSDYTKLYRFAGLKTRKFLLLYMKRYELDLINYCFRIVFNHYDEPFDLNFKKPFFDKYSSISIDKLITSKNIEELVDNLEGSEYYAPLKKLQESQASTLFDYNLALDLYYFTTVWKEKNKVLKGKELKIFTKEFGTKIDFLNMQWIYRAKKYYTMTAADIYSLLVPIHYHIHQDILKELVETSGTEEYVAAVYSTYYGQRYHLDNPLTLESVYSSLLHSLYTCDCRANPYSFSTINKYLFLKEGEINKLTTAIECIRYDLGSVETLRLIGGVTK